MIYHYMFPRHRRTSGPALPRAPWRTCRSPKVRAPSCTALIDMWDGTMPHLEGLGGNLVVVARAPIARARPSHTTRAGSIRAWSRRRTTPFGRDYGGDGPDGEPVPIMTVFKRWPDGVIRLHWASELIHEPPEAGQDPRHLGTVEPLWTLFDLTPAGRPAGDEQMAYPCCHGPRHDATTRPDPAQ